MFSLEQIMAAVPPVDAPGNHSPVAEEFRQAALQKLALIRFLAETLDISLRENPDDDAAFEVAARSFRQGCYDAGLLVDAFRNTRDVQGEG